MRRSRCPHQIWIAARIVAGASLKVLVTTPDFRLQVKGIGQVRLRRVPESWEEQKEVPKLVLHLAAHGIHASEPFMARERLMATAWQLRHFLSTVHGPTTRAENAQAFGAARYGLLRDASTLQQLQYEYDQSDHQKDVDEIAYHTKPEPEGPQHKQNDQDCPEHRIVLRTKKETSSAPTTLRRALGKCKRHAPARDYPVSESQPKVIISKCLQRGGRAAWLVRRQMERRQLKALLIEVEADSHALGDFPSECGFVEQQHAGRRCSAAEKTVCEFLQAA